MRDTTDILWNVTGQTLLYRVPQGRPASATFKVFDEAAGDDGTVEFQGSATVDTVNTTVSAASGPDQADGRKVSLTSVIGIVVGRKYRIAEGSREEWVEVVEIGSGFIRARHQLLHSYTTSATFVSTYISAAVDATWVADEANLGDLGDPNPDYRVRWAITVGGVEVDAYSYFDLVRGAGGHGVDLQDVTRRWAGLYESLPESMKSDQGRALLADAFKRVRLDLKRAGINVDAVREDEGLDEAVVLAARVLISEGGIHPRSFTAIEFVRLVTDGYERFMEQQFLISLKVPMATGTDSGADRRLADSLWEK